jgi:hypothetical protein
MTIEVQDEGTDRPLVSEGAVSIAVGAALFVLGLVLALDNYRLGIGWTKDGPQAGYFPFGLSVLMSAFSLYAIVDAVRRRRRERGKAFVTRAEFGRVLTVFVPVLLFAVVMQFLGIYVASAALIGGFMWRVGRMRWWISLPVGIATAVALFYIFEIQFQVPLPKGPLEDLLGY